MVMVRISSVMLGNSSLLFEDGEMSKISQIACVLAVLATPLIFAAESIDVVNPAAGSGASWTASPVDGTSAECPNGTPVQAYLYRKDSGVYVVIATCWATSTATDGTWTTTPGAIAPYQGPGPGGTWVYTDPGDYRAKATATFTNMHPAVSDQNDITVQ